MTWEHWTPSRLSTSLSLGDGTKVRTVEHMLAALNAHGIDNILAEIDGPEVPIFDGSAQLWCRRLNETGLEELDAPRRALRLRKPLQVSAFGGFLRGEPAEGFSVDVSYGCLLAFPVMRWHGPVDRSHFAGHLARARSFGDVGVQLGLEQMSKPRPRGDSSVEPNRRDPDLPPGGARWDEIRAGEAATHPNDVVFRGWRPWRTAMIVGGRVLPWPRYPDEPVRHVALDMIGDLGLVGLPLIGRFVAHDPSHTKTYAFVDAMMRNRDCWEIVEG